MVKYKNNNFAICSTLNEQSAIIGPITEYFGI